MSGNLPGLAAPLFPTMAVNQQTMNEVIKFIETHFPDEVILEQHIESR